MPHLHIVSGEDAELTATSEVCSHYVNRITALFCVHFEMVMGKSFNKAAFLSEAEEALDHVVRSAMFFGANMTVKEVSSVPIPGERTSLTKKPPSLMLLAD